MTLLIGIDPGLNGGIAAIYNSGDLVPAKTPVIANKEYDIQGMKSILVYQKQIQPNIFCTIENQISMPGQGLTSTLTTGKGFGIWLGLLAGLEIPYQIVGARQWQIKLFTGVSNKLDTKAKSEVVAKRLFPTVDFRKSERARKADDGLTDAACIAEYGRRTYAGLDKGSGIPHEAAESTPDICLKCGRFIPGDISGCIK